MIYVLEEALVVLVGQSYICRSVRRLQKATNEHSLPRRNAQ